MFFLGMKGGEEEGGKDGERVFLNWSKNQLPGALALGSEKGGMAFTWHPQAEA